MPRKDPWTMLSQQVLKQRIEAARTLRGITQTALDGLFDADGLGKSAGRIERGALEMQRAHRDAFCRHLKVPARWFNSPDVDEIVGYVELLPDYLSRDELSAAAALLAPELLGGVQALLREQALDAPGTGKPGHPPGDPGGGS